MQKSPTEEKPNAYLDRGLKQARPAMDANAVRFDEAAIDTGSSYTVVHPEDLEAYRIGETDWYKVNGFLRLTCDVEAAKFEVKYNSTDGGTARIAGHFA